MKQVQPGEDFYQSDIKDAYVKVAQKTMKNRVGLPIAIQVFSKTYQDEKALRVMKELQDYFQFFEKPNLDNLRNEVDFIW